MSNNENERTVVRRGLTLGLPSHLEEANTSSAEKRPRAPNTPAASSNTPSVRPLVKRQVLLSMSSPAVENSPAPSPIAVAAAAPVQLARILGPAGPYMTNEFKEKFYPVGAAAKGINAILNESSKIEKNKNNTWEGASSVAAVYKFPNDELYLVRKTPRMTPQSYGNAVKEIKIYKRLQTDLAGARNFITELVYADAYKSGGANKHQASYFVFKYEPGERLDHFIKSHRFSMTTAQVFGIYEHLLEGIRFMASKGVVHRDLKPENIWFSTERNIPLIFDFDAACVMTEDEEEYGEGVPDTCRSTAFVGTRKYGTPASLKQKRAEGFFNMAGEYTYSPIYDMYSAAVILQEDLSELVKPEEVVARAEADKAALLPENTAKFKGKGGSYGTNQMPHQNQRIGIMNPTWGGRRTAKKRRGGGCGCGGAPKPMMTLPAGLSLGPLTAALKGGGGCPCNQLPKLPTPLSGGYKATKRNLKYLKLWKKGKSIGFTMRSSLKAKGLIPRANGAKRVSNKYRR